MSHGICGGTSRTRCCGRARSSMPNRSCAICGAVPPTSREQRSPAWSTSWRASRYHAVLVLDDYHSITEPRCHEQMTFLLHHLPASVQVVLVTRADPPLPLARWRATGELAEFRAHDLRFTAAEAGPVVSALSGVELSESDLATLVERTEGWPTGLYLAAARPPRPSLPRRLRPPVLRRQRVHRRLPGRGGARPPAGRDPSFPRADLHPRPVLRTALRRGHRLGATRRRCWPPSSVRTPSSFPSTSPGSGSAITTCSPRRSETNSAGPSPASCPSCTGARAPGTGGPDWRTGDRSHDCRR